MACRQTLVVKPLGIDPGCLYRAARYRLLKRNSRVFSRRQSSVATLGDKPWYGTSPIFYVNAAPHVGHLYSLVLVDIFKRWHLLRGRKAIMCTGTDEHGMKIQRAAELANSEPKTFCDSGADTFRSLAARANISNDHFVRTTDADHRDAVQYAWTVLEERGLIYLSKHEGWYSVSDEAFYPASAVHQIIDPPTGRKMMASMETGKEVEWASETNYRFRLSAFRDRLLQFYRDNPTFIVPLPRMKDVVRAVEEGLEDLSISRPSSRLTWGIPVPGDDSQTIYVWLDALLNYATKAGFPWPPGSEHAKGWPADLHVIGKDIVRFHCIYWPAFLMALDLDLPKQILAHAHWTLGKEKMAKSTGNVVNPFFAIDRFGIDALRYYIAHDGGLQDDSDYGNEFIVERYKKGLQSGLGNLASRMVRGKKWTVRVTVTETINGSFDGQGGLANAFENDELARAQYQLLQLTRDKVVSAFDALDVGRALKEIMNMIYATNVFCAHAEPWTLAANLHANPEARTRLNHTVFLCVEALRIAAILLQPFMPGKCERLVKMLGIEEAHVGFDFAIVGADETYGTPAIDVGKGLAGALFPPLVVE